jgi:DNA-binding NarL/FixJ family response regulator
LPGRLVPETGSVPSRVLIVDDHSVFRSRARMLLESAGFDVVGEAVDAASALAESRRLEPDVVLLDVQLPDGDGFEVADELSHNVHAPQVVLISSRAAGDFGSRLALAHASGFIYKPDLSRASLEACLALP